MRAIWSYWSTPYRVHRRSAWARGQGVDATASERDYTDATRQIELRLLDASAKASITEFSSVRNYLNQRYLKDGHLDHKRPAVKASIRSKAARLFQRKPENGSWNRLLAVHYVIEFYEHIIPAVADNSLDHVRRVVHALRLGSSKRDDIAVNCFEMAIAIYFLNPAAIQAALEFGTRWPENPSELEYLLPPWLNS